MSELQTVKCYLNQLPATFLKLLGIDPPLNTISPPVQDILNLYDSVDRISINMIDNLPDDFDIITEYSEYEVDYYYTEAADVIALNALNGNGTIEIYNDGDTIIGSVDEMIQLVEDPTIIFDYDDDLYVTENPKVNAGWRALHKGVE